LHRKTWYSLQKGQKMGQLELPNERGPQTDSKWAKIAYSGVIVLAAIAGMLMPEAWMEQLQIMGSAISPQRPEHSLFIAGIALPLEARMLGIQLGFLATLVMLGLFGRAEGRFLPAWPKMTVMLGFVAIMGLDGLNATLFDNGLPYAYVPNNWLRLATGLLNGLAVGVIVLAAINSLRKSECERLPGVESWKELLSLIVVMAVLFGAIIGSSLGLPHPTVTESAAVIAVLALHVFSTLGIVGELVMLTMINALFLISVLKRIGFQRVGMWIFLTGIVMVLDAVELVVLITSHLALVERGIG
jgi:uncharacterized membrane protein